MAACKHNVHIGGPNILGIMVLIQSCPLLAKWPGPIRPTHPPKGDETGGRERTKIHEEKRRDPEREVRGERSTYIQRLAYNIN